MQSADRQDWSSFVGPFGKMSWSRIGDEVGRTQVGLHFMLNVALIDRASFSVSLTLSVAAKNQRSKEYGAREQRSSEEL